MPRYAILTHDHPFLHWDLLLEWGANCRCWRLLSEPHPGAVVAAQALPEHRTHYLTYEGPVSGGRGSVARWDVGTYHSSCVGDQFVRIACHGRRQIAGMMLQTVDTDGMWEILAMVAPPADVRAEVYRSYVEHPRFGREPLWTGRDPRPEAEQVWLHWINQFLPGPGAQTLRSTRSVGAPEAPPAMIAIRGTALAADLSQQVPSAVPVTHYYDVNRLCRDCGSRFIFFALEQKFWYERLQFNLSADAVRCPECRRLDRELGAAASRYADLLHSHERSAAETTELIECGVRLAEAGVFRPTIAERLRYFVRQLPSEFQASDRMIALDRRVAALMPPPTSGH